MSKVMDEIRHEAKEEERIQNIATLLANGGTEDDAKRLLNATPQELEQAKRKK